MERPKVAVLAVTFRGGDVILVQRKNEPQKGTWGFPGGSVELGESLAEAALRELKEETGTVAEVIGPGDIVELRERDSSGKFHHFILIAMVCRYRHGVLRPGDDAAACRWLNMEKDLGTFSGTLAEHVLTVAHKGRSMTESFMTPCDHQTAYRSLT